MNLVVDKNEKADYLYLLANIYLSLKNYQQAVNYAKQALTITPNDGRCYILMGVCYSTAKMHSEDPVLSRCVYWVACDMFEKAKQVDSSCAADANKLIATYKQYFPSKEDIFFHREVNEGSSFHVGGWIDRTTTCRSK